MRKIALILVAVILLNLTSCGVVDWVKNGDEPELYTGIDGYIESGREKSSLGVTCTVVYSTDFLTDFDYVEGDYNYYVHNRKHIWHDDTDYYECCIFELEYDANVYAEAKAELKKNTNYLSIDFEYEYNGYEFYRLSAYARDGQYFFAHVFDDTQNKIILLGCYANYKNTLDDFIERGETWLDFLNVYFGDYYDFDA